MGRRFQFRTLWVVIVSMALTGFVVDFFERAKWQRAEADSSQRIKVLEKQLAALRESIQRLEQRPRRGKIEDTYDKFDVPKPLDELLPELESGRSLPLDQ